MKEPARFSATLWCASCSANNRPAFLLIVKTANHKKLFVDTFYQMLVLGLRRCQMLGLQLIQHLVQVNAGLRQPVQVVLRFGAPPGQRFGDKALLLKSV